MAAFVQGQQTKTTGQFFTSVYDAWHEKYPSANPSDEQLASANGDTTKAQALVIKKRERSVFPLPHATHAMLWLCYLWYQPPRTL